MTELSSKQKEDVSVRSNFARLEDEGSTEHGKKQIILKANAFGRLKTYTDNEADIGVGDVW